MTFVFKNGELRVGDAAGKALISVLTDIKKVMETKGVSIADALNSIKDGKSIDRKTLISALQKQLADKGKKPLADMLASLRDIETRSSESDRQIGWPAKSWSTDVGNSPITLNLRAEGGAYFEVLADDPELPQQLSKRNQFEAAGKLVLSLSLIHI